MLLFFYSWWYRYLNVALFLLMFSSLQYSHWKKVMVLIVCFKLMLKYPTLYKNTGTVYEPLNKLFLKSAIEALYQLFYFLSLLLTLNKFTNLLQCLCHWLWACSYYLCYTMATGQKIKFSIKKTSFFVQCTWNL